MANFFNTKGPIKPVTAQTDVASAQAIQNMLQ
jgi:hypothetical protein